METVGTLLNGFHVFQLHSSKFKEWIYSGKLGKNYPSEIAKQLLNDNSEDFVNIVLIRK